MCVTSSGQYCVCVRVPRMVSCILRWISNSMCASSSAMGWRELLYCSGQVSSDKWRKQCISNWISQLVKLCVWSNVVWVWTARQLRKYMDFSNVGRFKVATLHASYFLILYDSITSFETTIVEITMTNENDRKS